MFDVPDWEPLRAVRGRYAARLGSALFVAIVLLLVISLVVQAQTARQVRENADANLQHSTEVQANELDVWLGVQKRDIREVSDREVMQQGDPGAISPVLRDLDVSGKTSAEIEAIHYLDATGEARYAASSRPDYSGAGVTGEDAPFLSTVREELSSPDQVYISRPYTTELADHPVVALVSPVEGGEDRFLVFVVDPRSQIENLEQPVEGGATQVVAEDGAVIARPPEVTGTDGVVQAVNLSGASGVERTGDGTVVAFSHLRQTDWVVLITAPRSNVYALSAIVRRGTTGMLLAALVVLGLIVVTVGRSTARALRELAEDARRLGDGDHSVEFDVDRADEFGTLSDSLTAMRDSLRENIEKAERAREEADRRRRATEETNEHLGRKAEEYGDALTALSNGDLTRRVDPESDNEAMEQVGVAINDTVAALARTVAEVKTFADRVAAASQQVDGGAADVRRASEEASEAVRAITDGATDQSEKLSGIAADVDTLSATAEEVASSVDELARTADRAAAAGEQGRAAAEEVIGQMNDVEAQTEQTVDRIETLDDEMSAIVEITDFIGDIAEQTNILALNASIEASRAGEAGAGFAVVAEEVKSLAEETRDAAEDIEDRIERVQEETGEAVADIQTTRERVADGVTTVEETVEALETVADYVDDTDERVRGISDATSDQAQSVQSVSETVDDLTAISEETSAEAEEVSAAVEEQVSTLENVSAGASDLSDRASQLRSMLEEFDVDDEARPDDVDAVADADADGAESAPADGDGPEGAPTDAPGAGARTVETSGDSERGANGRDGGASDDGPGPVEVDGPDGGADGDDA